MDKSGGVGSAAAISTKKSTNKKKQDPARLEKYAEQLQQWVLGKLKQWDEDESFQAERAGKYETKEGFESYLRAKVETKMAKLQEKL